jgi:hypothetical protein
MLAFSLIELFDNVTPTNPSPKIINVNYFILNADFFIIVEEHSRLMTVTFFLSLKEFEKLVF